MTNYEMTFEYRKHPTKRVDGKYHGEYRGFKFVLFTVVEEPHWNNYLKSKITLWKSRIYCPDDALLTILDGEVTKRATIHDTLRVIDRHIETHQKVA